MAGAAGQVKDPRGAGQIAGHVNGREEKGIVKIDRRKCGLVDQRHGQIVQGPNHEPEAVTMIHQGVCNGYDGVRIRMKRIKNEDAKRTAMINLHGAVAHLVFSHGYQ